VILFKKKYFIINNQQQPARSINCLTLLRDEWAYYNGITSNVTLRRHFIETVILIRYMSLLKGYDFPDDLHLVLIMKISYNIL
jgi:hypothetical protein